MSYTAVQRGPETDAVIAALAAQVATGDADRPTGAGYATDGDPTSVFVPYVVVWPSIIEAPDGPVSDPFADVASEYLIRGEGATRAQAQWALDKARAVLLSSTLTISGRFVQLVEWTTAQPVSRDDDVNPALWSGSDLYVLHTTPA